MLVKLETTFPKNRSEHKKYLSPSWKEMVNTPGERWIGAGHWVLIEPCCHHPVDCWLYSGVLVSVSAVFLSDETVSGRVTRSPGFPRASVQPAICRFGLHLFSYFLCSYLPHFFDTSCFQRKCTYTESHRLIDLNSKSFQSLLASNGNSSLAPQRIIWTSAVNKRFPATAGAYLKTY